MELKVNISKEDEERLYQQAREDIKSELTEEAVKDYIRNSKSLNVLGLMRDFGIYTKYEELKDSRINDLTSNEKFIVMMKWLMYGIDGWSQ